MEIKIISEKEIIIEGVKIELWKGCLDISCPKAKAEVLGPNHVIFRNVESTK